MRRVLSAAVFAVLAVAVASPANAGYLIIRVILDGSAAGPGAGEPGAFPGGEGPPGGAVRPGGLQLPPVRPGGGEGPAVGPAATPAPRDPTRSVVVVVPVLEDLNKRHPFYGGNFHPVANPNYAPQLRVAHRGEKFTTNLFADNTTVQWYENLKETPSFLRTHAFEVRDRVARYAAKPKADAKPDPKAGFDLVVAALGLGLVDEAVTAADVVLAAAGGKPDGLPPEVAGFVRAYGPIQKGLKERAPKPGSAEAWREKLEAAGVSSSPHYTLLYWEADEDEARRRLALLEENFKAFYLLHATRGVGLRLPEAPLVAALARPGKDPQGKDYGLTLARALDAPDRLPADGYYSPGHDVLVLFPERLDPVGQTFSRQVGQMYRDGVSQRELLAGRGPKVDANGQNGLRRPEDVARMQTLALVERLANDAAAAAAVTREGSLQLLHATGRLPRYVALPRWVSSGAADFHARPKEPAFVADEEGKKWSMTVAPEPGYGGPNYAEQRYFRDLLEKKDLDPDPAALLRNVLTDAYFLGLRDPKTVSDPDPVKPEKKGAAVGGGGGAVPVRPPFGGRPMGEDAGPVVGVPGVPAGPQAESPAAVLQRKQDRLAVKAQATAWALYYYLAKAKPAELAGFAAELAALPRDLPLDGGTVTAAFGRAFGLDGSKESLAGFANGWLEYMAAVGQAGVNVPLVDPKPPAAGTPMNPMGTPVIPGAPGPGGPPGSPGGAGR